MTHTFRVTTTSDIWVTESTFVELPVTVYTTERDFVPEVARTVTSVLRVTTTPVRRALHAVCILDIKEMFILFIILIYASPDLVLGFQVAIKTAEEFVNPSRTFVSVFTSFVTTTETVKFWQSIYHVSTDYQVIGLFLSCLHALLVFKNLNLLYHHPIYSEGSTPIHPLKDF